MRSCMYLLFFSNFHPSSVNSTTVRFDTNDLIVKGVSAGGKDTTVRIQLFSTSEY